MSKIILFVVIAIVVVMTILNGGANTSSQEMALDSAQVANKISEINSSIQTAGNLVFGNIWVEGSAFKGEIEQPASSATDKVFNYMIKGKESDDNFLKLTFGNSKISVEDKGTTYTDSGIVDANIPKSSRDAILHPTPDAVVKEIGEEGNPAHPLNGVDTGIQPILKGDDANRKAMMELLLFSEQGFALDRLTQYSDELGELKGKESNQETFLKWLFGNGENPVWNEYKIDRILALKEINENALTGLDMSNQTVMGLLDPNRMTVYQVSNVNTTNFNKLKVNSDTDAPITATEIGLDGGGDIEDKFILDLANHLNQVIGGKTLLIPHNDSFIVYDSDGNPMFKLN